MTRHAGWEENGVWGWYGNRWWWSSPEAATATVSCLLAASHKGKLVTRMREMENYLSIANNLHVKGLFGEMDPRLAMATLETLRYLPPFIENRLHQTTVEHQKDGNLQLPPMETWVLIPPELSLVVTPVAGDNDSIPKQVTRVWTHVPVTQGRRWSPFQGTVRLGVVPADYPFPDDDVRSSYGCYEEISPLRVRHCNWVRFLRYSLVLSQEVNVVCSKIKGEPVYEAIRPIAAQTELVVFYLPNHSDNEELFLPAVKSLRSSLFRRTMGLILEESPLDLSMSLLSRVLVPPPGGMSGSDGRQSVSSESVASSAGEQEQETATAANSGRPARQRPLLPCQVCGKAFDRPSLLNRHMRTHTGEKPHVCDICGKGFSTSSSLNTHRRIHSGEKPHQCPVCGKRFTASSNLYYHRMTHIKEKPHKCALCSKSFPTPGDLKSHMYVHNGSWPFKCHVCSRGFSKHTNLKNHLFLHTGDKPHACELCNKRFALACNLRAHMKTHEGEPQEECGRCGKNFLLSAQNADLDGLCPDCKENKQTN